MSRDIKLETRSPQAVMEWIGRAPATDAIGKQFNF
jgi:hypothetical protein